MPQIGYRQWGLIPADNEPTAGQIYTARPPMMTALAVDKHSSLLFELAKTPAQLQAEIEVTALSGEKCKMPPMHLFTGADGEQFHSLAAASWHKTQEGIYLVFRVQFDAPERFVKLNYTQNHALIVNKVTFSTL
jgi:hypothetical protein